MSIRKSAQPYEMDEIKASGMDKGASTGVSQVNLESGQQQSSFRSSDENVIARFGKKQVLTRRFKRVSTVGLTCGIMLTWIAVLSALSYGLNNGGTAGLIYGYLAAWAGCMLQALVMAEIASMIPLAGGPFNWVAVLAPPSYRKFLSYIAGWLTLIAWQCTVSGVTYQSASFLQGLVILNYPNYEPQLWHATLIFWAVLAWAGFVNIYLGRLLPRVEALTLCLYLAAFLVIIIPLGYLAPKKSAHEVFTTFQDTGGWGSTALSFFVGWVASTSSFIGIDGSDHVAEEVHDAATIVPFAIWFSPFINGILGLAMLIMICFCIPDVVADSSSDTGYPIMTIFEQALGSEKAASGMTILILVVDIISVQSILATASRVMWAFSRENGLPGSKYLVKVSPTTRLPINSVLVTMCVSFALSLVSLGSVTAYLAFFSAILSTYHASFLIAASLMLYKRLTTPSSDLPWGPFRLGVTGVPITILGIIYSLLAFFFSFWPNNRQVDAATMNWSSAIIGVCIIGCITFWFVHARKIYTGPIWEFNEGDIVRVNPLALSEKRGLPNGTSHPGYIDVTTT